MNVARLVRALSIGLVTVVAFLAGDAQAAPKRGGDMVFAQEAQVPNGLDMHFSSAISTRNIAMHMYEALLTRDESNAPIADLAERWVASPDGLTYTFPLRKGVLFHNGKEMTSADVLASFQRYEKLGVDRKMLEQVASMSSPEKYTFQLKLKRAVPTFIEELSSFRVPIVIMPVEETVKPAGKTEPYIGTGPYQFVEWVPDSHVKLKRFDRYKVNETLPDRTGFGGRKIAYFDTVTFRIVTEGGRAGGRTREGRVPCRRGRPHQGGPALQREQAASSSTPSSGSGSTSPSRTTRGRRPTTSWSGARSRSASTWKTSWRRPSDGAYKLQPGYQYPGNPYYTDAGKERYDVRDKEQAQAAPPGGRLQGRGSRPHHQHRLPEHVQRLAGHGRAAQGPRHDREGRGLRLAHGAEEAG